VNTNSIIDAATTAVAAQADIEAWSQEQYGMSYNVFENIDLRDPPDPDECPAIVVRPLTKAGGMNRPVKTTDIGVDCLVFDERKNQTASGVIQFLGSRMVEELRKMIFAKIQAAIPSDLHIVDLEVDYDTVEQFPYCWCGMAITIEQEQLIGVNPYE
jgi:hypothetical protein